MNQQITEEKMAAPCGHPVSYSFKHCGVLSCYNYYMKCPNWGHLDHARRDRLAIDEAAAADRRIELAILESMSVTLQSAGADQTAVIDEAKPMLRTRMWVNGVWTEVDIQVVKHQSTIR